jgi:hypothetical protein
MLPLSGLSPVAGKKVVVNFDGGLLTEIGPEPAPSMVHDQRCLSHRTRRRWLGEAIMLAHGFTVETLGRLVLDGHATATPGIIGSGPFPARRGLGRISGAATGRAAVATTVGRLAVLSDRPTDAGRRARGKSWAHRRASQAQTGPVFGPLQNVAHIGVKRLI